MNISSVSINRPVLATVMSIVIVLFGLIGYKYLGVREFPSIDPPVITVKTTYTGANADIIESQITEPLEKSINGIAGIRSISSSSSTGTSSITVEFNLDEDLETAANDVRDKVSQAVRFLPLDIDGPPVVTKADANSDAIIALTLQSNTRSQLEVSDYAENVVLERLQTIPGVSTVQIWGQKKYAMRIWMDPFKLASYQLTAADVWSALNKENVELPSGKIEGYATELSVRTMGRLTTEDEFNNLIVKNDGTRIIKLADIGRATLGAENENTMLKESGIPMIGLGVVPQPGANYIEIADEFYKRLDQIKKDIPEDFKLDIALDNTKFIKTSILEVQETLIIAFVLVVLIIYLFFRDWLIAFRPLIDIPVSLIGAFFIMYVAGFSINILTLLAIVLATGLVVDDGIVVTENIYKKIEEGMDPITAAHEGSKEIFFAVISTSVTLAAVFLPIIFLEGFVGRLFREFGIVVAGAVLISAFVSLTLTPMLNVKMARKDHTKRTRFYEWSEPFFVGMTNAYRNSLGKFLKIRWVAIAILLASFGTIWYINGNLQSELAPLDDRSVLRVSATAPEGTSFDYMLNYMDNVSKFIKDSVPENKIAMTITAPGFSGTGAMNTGVFRIALTDPQDRSRSQQEIADYLSKNLKSFPSAKLFVVQEQTISGGGGGSKSGLPVQYVIQSSDFKKLSAVLPKFMEEVGKNPTFMGYDVNLKFNKPELIVKPDRERAKALGVSVSDIAQTLQLSFSGQRFGYFNMNGKQYQVIGQLDRTNRDQPLNLSSLYVKNKDGVPVQMDNLVKIEETNSPPQLYHFNRYKSATVSAGLAPGKTIGDGIEAMDQISKKLLDDSFSTSLNGPSRDYAESSSNILFAFALALVLIYLILSAQFESFIDPLVIMLTVPLALAGAFITLYAFGQTINIFSQIGIIILIGLVTKNGILIVEFANHKIEEGLSVMDAAREAAAARLRPILMTSLATILGAVPIAFAIGAGAKSRIPMGLVIIGGLLFSLILTLYVIPAMYTFLSRKKIKKTEIKEEAKKIEYSYE
ncbi:MAG: efflux RND transporter permease subunit [Sporocytophaga sp.]|nr:efflux RND transporter permease subunit [Sporocytophaga sp.]